MPFYEYQCKSCGHELEAMQKVSDPPLKKCPHCGRSQLQRLISAPVFRLKGAGWYETDFKDNKDKKRNLADRADGDFQKEESAKPAEAKSDATSENAKDQAALAQKPAEKTQEIKQLKKKKSAALRARARKVANKAARK